MGHTMYRLKISKGVFCCVLLFNLFIGIRGGKTCNPDDLVHISDCSTTQNCDADTHTCVCLPGLARINDTFCGATVTQDVHSTTPSSASLVSSHHSGSIVAGILIPLFLILLVIYAIYVSRKYHFVSWFRRKIHHRNNNYDEFMIGHDADVEDDDPPLR